MQTQKLKRASIFLHVTYFALCTLDIIICLLYVAAHSTAIGRVLADIALGMTGSLGMTCLPAFLSGLILNLCIVKKSADGERKHWTALCIVFAIACLVFFFAAIGTFITLTGGV